MKLQVSKWGNSLAVRLPVECTREAGLKEGDSVEASITPAGAITLATEKTFDKAGRWGIENCSCHSRCFQSGRKWLSNTNMGCIQATPAFCRSLGVGS